MDLVEFGVMALGAARADNDENAQIQIWKDIHTEARDEFPVIEAKIKEILN